MEMYKTDGIDGGDGHMVAPKDGEAVNLIQGLEVAEVREELSREIPIKVVDVDLSNVLEEATFTHVRQEAELMVAQPPVTCLLPPGENTPVISRSQA